MGKSISMLVFCLFFVWGNGKAENLKSTTLQVRHREPVLIERNTPFELTFSVPGMNPSDVLEAYVFYRPDGDMVFTQKKATLTTSGFKTELIVEDQHATSLEYYLEIRLNNGERLTFPQNEASSEPVRVEVIDQRVDERERRVAETGVDYTILSPDPGAVVNNREVVVAITLFYDPSRVDTSATPFRMLLDGKDITKKANASNYFYTYSPDELSAGDHSTSIVVQKADTSLTLAKWNFTVIDPGAEAATSSSSENSWIPEGKVELAAQDQQVGGLTNDALSGKLRLSGQKGSISYSAHGLLTTQEDPRLQAQNRFGASLRIGDWLELEAGHVYPRLSPLTISGQRMQGLNAGLHIWDKAVNLHFLYGKLSRGINNIYLPVEPEYQTFEGDPLPVDTSYVLSIDESGTYEREVIGGRLGMGRGEKFKFGLNFLKVQDDTSSIHHINDFTSLMEVNPALADRLTREQQEDLSQNPGQLRVSGNPRPKGNFVAATDLDFSIDSNRIHFEADGAVSLLNRDISEGILNAETAEKLGLSFEGDIENLLDRLSWLIIINENMNTLPFRFKIDDNGNATAETFFPTGILATQSELGLNYFNNDLRLQYRWVGPEYNSLANSTIRKDIAGFSVSDRLRLFENRIYLTLGYEQLRDNVINNKDATTKTITYRTNISWYPISQNLPRVSIGLMTRSRDNGVELMNPYLTGSRETAAVRNFRIQQGDTLAAPRPRLSDTYQLSASLSQQFSLWGLTHDARLNYSILTTRDRQFRYGDAFNNSLSGSLVTHFEEIPLQTTVGFNLNRTQTASGLTDISIAGANFGGTLFLLNDKLQVNASLALTKNVSETYTLLPDENGTPQQTADDYYSGSDTGSVSESSSYIIGTSARYNLNARHAFLVNFRYSNIRNAYSAVAIPDDHLLQARYIFNF